MAVQKSVVTGFNHNIKHKGKVYHIQTEDSGADAAHIITHLFVGGNILASRKTSYADIRNAENLKDVVRELMEEQHKEMLRNLINGVYDEIEQAFHSSAQSFKPGQIRVSDGVEVQLNAGTPNSNPVSDITETKATSGPPLAHVAPIVQPSAAVAAANAAERAAGAAFSTPPVPQPPAPVVARPPPQPAPILEKPAPGLLDAGDSLFGEDLISEKSLDEVILSYLAGEDGKP
jgi:hypothetical protein